MAILNPQKDPEAPDAGNLPSSQNAADPELQDAFDQFVINGLKILYAPDVAAGIVKRVKANPDTIAAIGDATLDIVARLEKSASKEAKEPVAHTVVNGLNVIMGEIINIVEAAGMQPLEDEQKYQAFSWVVAKYISDAVRTGRVTKEELVDIGTQIMMTKEGNEAAQGLAKQEAFQGEAGQHPGMPENQAGGLQPPRRV